MATALLCGCQPIQHDQPELQRWGGILSDFRVSWDGAPGIDVESGPAVPARAFVESFKLAQYMGDIAYAYPGFAQAVTEQGNQRELWSRRPVLDAPLSKPLVGSESYRIMSVRQSGQITAVTVCNFRYAIGIEQDDGMFRSAGRNGVAEGRGITAVQVGLIAPDNPSDLPPQAGPLPAPADDVFGGWQVLGMLTFFSTKRPGFDAQWPTYAADQDECVEKAPMPPERRAFLVDGEHPRSDFPTSPATPGWPQES